MPWSRTSRNLAPRIWLSRLSSPAAGSSSSTTFGRVPNALAMLSSFC